MELSDGGYAGYRHLIIGIRQEYYVQVLGIVNRYRYLSIEGDELWF